MKKIAIIGSGSWGCALAIHAANLGNNVTIWSFSDEEANIINNERKCKFLPNASMPENILCSTNMEEVVADSDIILHVTPSKFVRETIKKYKMYVKDQILAVCSKGFETDTLYTLSEIVEEEMSNIKYGIKLAKPANTKLVIKNMDASVEALVSGVTDKYKLFIVVESIADVYKLCKETGMIDKITLGGVKSREGTRQISKAVFTTPKEEELLKELITDGVTVEIRQVPSDSVIYAKDVL